MAGTTTVAIYVSASGASIGLIGALGANPVGIFDSDIGAAAGANIVILLSTYIGWRILAGDKKYSLIRKIIIVFAAKRGTSFYNADLTDANFKGATLKSTDLTKATLIRTCWQNTIKLDLARPGTSYLQYEHVRQLLITGKVQNKNFDRLDLRGINLKGAKLQDASFIGTDLNRANLQNADLSKAKLVQTLLEGADLTRATLTGACIEGWGISNTTKLIEIDCQEIFLKLSTENGSKFQQRRPADKDRPFDPGEFAKLVQKIPNTVDLVFQYGIDWQTFLKTFQELRVESETGELPVIKAIENKDDGAFVIRVKVPEEVDEAEYERKVWAKYKPILDAKDQKIKSLSEQKEEQKEFYYKQIEILKEIILKDNNNKLIEIVKIVGIVEKMVEKMPEKETTKIDQRVQHIQGDYVEGSKGDTITQTNSSTSLGVGVSKGPTNIHNNNISVNTNEPQSEFLAQAAAEIKELLQKLERDNPTATEAEQEAFVSAAITPTKKERLINALKEGGQGAIEEFLDNPYVNVAIRIIEGWRNP
ncbi:MAG: pentapeptide repeat-containing protein [Moorea sp. SIO3I7]|nr:pentapeptide repeat-containing protein [Moorena sp. SIO3I7]